MASEEENVKIASKSKSMFTKLKTLRIVVIEPRGQYCRMICCAVGLGISHIMIGATIMSVLIYSIIHNDWHAILISVAYHFFSLEAILSLNYANGWSAPMRLKHRRFTHVFLQMCAMAFAIAGTVYVTLAKGFALTPHGITGVITAAFACISFLSGPCALFGRNKMRVMHISFGMPTFIMSSVSFCCGLLTQAFKDWAPLVVTYVLIGFIVFYTTFIMAMCFVKYVSRF